MRATHTDHLYHRPGHHSLRCLGRGWKLRLRLWRSVPGRGLGLAVWGQPEELRSSELQAGERYMPRARERNTRAEGTWEKVWTRRRGKGPLLGTREEEGWTTVENSLH